MSHLSDTFSFRLQLKLWVINHKGVKFLSELANRLTLVADDPRESSFLFQCIFILIQRFNAICFQVTLDQPA